MRTTYNVYIVTLSADGIEQAKMGEYADKAKAMNAAKRAARTRKDCQPYGPDSLCYVGPDATAVVSWGAPSRVVVRANAAGAMREVDYATVVGMMDDALREMIASNFSRLGVDADDYPQEFVDEYAAAHERAFGAPFIVN